MIKAVVFDIGEVFIFENNDKTNSELEEKFNLNPKKFVRLRHRYLDKAIIKNSREFWYEEQMAKKFKVNFKEFIEYWQNLKRKNFKLNKSVIEIIKTLKKNKYPLYSLTDVTYSHDIIRKEIGIYKYFKFNLKSNKLKTKKPRKKIYKLLIDKLNLKPEEIIFIDDKMRNVLGARKLKINAIHFENSNQLKKDLIKFGVKN